MWINGSPTTGGGAPPAAGFVVIPPQATPAQEAGRPLQAYVDSGGLDRTAQAIRGVVPHTSMVMGHPQLAIDMSMYQYPCLLYYGIPATAIPLMPSWGVPKAHQSANRGESFRSAPSGAFRAPRLLRQHLEGEDELRGIPRRGFDRPLLNRNLAPRVVLDESGGGDAYLSPTSSPSPHRTSTLASQSSPMTHPAVPALIGSSRQPATQSHARTITSNPSGVIAPFEKQPPVFHFTFPNERGGGIAGSPAMTLRSAACPPPSGGQQPPSVFPVAFMTTPPPRYPAGCEGSLAPARRMGSLSLRSTTQPTAHREGPPAPPPPPPPNWQQQAGNGSSSPSGGIFYKRSPSSSGGWFQSQHSLSRSRSGSMNWQRDGTFHRGDGKQLGSASFQRSMSRTGGAQLHTLSTMSSFHNNQNVYPEDEEESDWGDPPSTVDGGGFQSYSKRGSIHAGGSGSLISSIDGKSNNPRTRGCSAVRPERIPESNSTADGEGTPPESGREAATGSTGGAALSYHQQQRTVSGPLSGASSSRRLRRGLAGSSAEMWRHTGSGISADHSAEFGGGVLCGVQPGNNNELFSPSAENPPFENPDVIAEDGEHQNGNEGATEYSSVGALTNLPPAFFQYLEKGGGDALKIAAAMIHGHSKRYIRLNVRSGYRDFSDLPPECELEQTCHLQPVPWLDPSFRCASLPASRRLIDLEAYSRRLIFGVDAASLFAVQCLDVQEDHEVLDLCCAPGSKIFAIADRTRKNVIGIDINATRLGVCRKLATQYGVQNCLLLEADGTTFDPSNRDTFSVHLDKGKSKKGNRNHRPEATKPDSLNVKIPLLFDRVLVDAECTHDGSIRHLRKYEWQFGWDSFQKRVMEPDRLERLPALQLALVQSGWRVLKPGGKLVYSTCSLCKDQNQKVVEAFLHDQCAAEGMASVLLPGIPFELARDGRPDRNKAAVPAVAIDLNVPWECGCAPDSPLCVAALTAEGGGVEEGGSAVNNAPADVIPPGSQSPHDISESLNQSGGASSPSRSNNNKGSGTDPGHPALHPQCIHRRRVPRAENQLPPACLFDPTMSETSGQFVCIIQKPLVSNNLAGSRS